MSRVKGVLEDPLLSVVMPVYNERQTVEEIIRRVLAVPLRLELIVVDDASTDGTRDILAALQAERGFTLILAERNRGKGAALRRGFEAVTGDVVVIQDADLEYSPEEYPQLMELICQGRADVVYGSRFAAKAHPEGMRRSNFVANRVLTTTANLLYGVHITDEATCFKVFRTELLRALELECTGFEFCPEVTAKLGLRKVPIAEVPIQYRARTNAEGKKVRWTDGFEAMWVLVKHRLRRRVPDRP